MLDASSKFWRWSGSILTLAAFVFFCWHGVWRGFAGGDELAALYAGSAAWSDGADPYVFQEAAAAMARRGGELDPAAIVLHPPSALALFAPMTWMGWKAARIAWVVVQLFSCLGLAAWLQQLAGGKLRHGLPGWMFVMALLLWWPIHTGFFAGQVALPVAALTVMAVGLAEKGARWRGGVLLGIALALKPELAVVGLGGMALRGHGRALLWSVLLVGAMWALAVWKLAPHNTAHEVTWKAHWMDNLGVFFRGGHGDVALPWARAQMVQASALLASLGLASAAALGAALAAFLGCFWLIWQWPRRREMDALEVLAACSLVMLLAVYHSSHDAVWALIPLAHGLRLIAANRRSVAGWGLVVALAVFLTPGGAMAPASLQGAWWGQFQTMGLLAAMGIMIAPIRGPLMIRSGAPADDRRPV